MIPFFQVTKMESRVFVPPDELHAHKQYALNCEVQLRNPRVFTASTPFGEKQENLLNLQEKNPIDVEITLQSVLDLEKLNMD